MSLIENMKIFMPFTPDPPTDEMQNISNALESAISFCIRISFIPSLGVVFLSSLASPTPFIQLLAAHIDATISPIIATAQSVQVSLGGPIAAWVSVQPSFDALLPAVPAFMAGPFGNLFWAAILLTIRLAISIPSIDETSSTTDSTESTESRDEVLRVES